MVLRFCIVLDRVKAFHILLQSSRRDFHSSGLSQPHVLSSVPGHAKSLGQEPLLSTELSMGSHTEGDGVPSLGSIQFVD